jgi:hypothetical protein
MKDTIITKQTFELVKGDFSTNAAKEILLNLIDQKISFHNLRDWRSQEKYGKPDEHSLKRINELKESRATILEIIQVAKEEGLTLNINANISVELTNS